LLHYVAVLIGHITSFDCLSVCFVQAFYSQQKCIETPKLVWMFSRSCWFWVQLPVRSVSSGYYLDGWLSVDR